MHSLTRRDMLRLVACGALTLGAEQSQKLPPQFLASADAAVAAHPSGPIVRTVLEDIQPQSLGNGAVLLHEHLSFLGTTRAGQKDNVSELIALMTKAKSAGVSCVVDAGGDDTGRDIGTLRQLARESKVYIVASGGYYTKQTYPAELGTQSEDGIAETLVRKASADRYGALGEIGESPNQPLDPLERKVLRAVGKAHVQTGLPIRTHTAYGTGIHVPKDAGLVQLDTLESVGVRPEHVLIGHVCCDDDPKVEAAKAIAKRGAFVGFDRATFVMYISDEKKMRMILAMLDAGYENKLCLSSDFASAFKGSKMWTPTVEQGVGYERTVTVFVPMLRKAGVGERAIQNMTSNNPRRLITFVPKRI